VARTCRSRAAFSTALIGSPLLVVVVVVVVVAVLAGAVEKGLEAKELREGPLPLRSGIVVRDMEQEEGLTTAEVVVVVAESAEFGVEAAVTTQPGFGVDTTFFCCSSRLRRSLASSARLRLTLPPSSSENIL
jgi:hypothetical protein